MGDTVVDISTKVVVVGKLGGAAPAVEEAEEPQDL